MIPETIEDLEKINWGFIIMEGQQYYSTYIIGYYLGEIHKYYSNEMYLISSIPTKFITLNISLIYELNNYFEKKLPCFSSENEFKLYFNRIEKINSVLNE